MWLQRERKDDVIWSDLKLGGHLELNAILFQSWSKLRSRSRLTSFIGSNILRSSSHTTLWYLQVKHQHLKTNLQGSRLICTSWFPVNQISNFKFSGFFRVLFVLWSLKYPHQRGQQTPRVSTELEILAYLSFSFIPLQNILQKSVDRPVKNPQKRAESITMAPNAPDKILLAHVQQNASLLRGREHHFRTGERAE